MKKFKFRLEQVLNYRLAIKAERKRELMLKNAALKEAEDELERLKKALLNNSISATNIQTIEQIVIVSSYSERLKTLIEHQNISIFRLQQEVEEALAAYIEAAKESSALEKLKERRRSEYVQWVAKEDERYLDELAVQRAGRNQALEKQENQHGK